MQDSIEQQLKRIESKIDRLTARLAPDESDPEKLPGYKLHSVVRIEHYVSGSGNPTWKAFDDDDTIIYLRQSHRELLESVNLWDELNKMTIGDDWECKIQVGTVPDGDFRRPVHIEYEWDLYGVPAPEDES